MGFLSSPRIAKLDGRWLIVGCVLFYFATIFAAHFVMDYHRFWRWLAVPSTAPAFADMNGLIQGGENARDGFDPILGNPANPVRSTANYPHLWFWPLVALRLDERDTVACGLGLALTFYACVLWFAGRLTAWQGAVWSVLLCAPPAMLAVERGNNDLVIFDGLALALIARRSATGPGTAGSYALIEACALLKLYPFSAFCLALREKPRAAAATLAAGGVIFAAYVYAIRDQVKAIRAVLPQSHGYTYGSHVFSDRYNLGHPGAIPWLAPTLAAVAVLVLAAVARGLCPRLPALPKPSTDALMVGSALYGSSFVLNNNFNYRLVFLLFTVPALLALLQTPGFYRRLAAGLLSALVAGWAFSCWALPGRLEWWLFVCKELANWTVFGGMAFLWLECLPGSGGVDRATVAEV